MGGLSTVRRKSHSKYAALKICSQNLTMSQPLLPSTKRWKVVIWPVAKQHQTIGASAWTHLRPLVKENPGPKTGG